jgi:hypothetical protein
VFGQTGAVPVYDGQAGDAPVFDALDVPTHVTLRRAVRNHQVLGWGMTLLGLAGLVALLAAGETYEAAAAFPMAVFFGALMWLFVRRDLRAALAAPRPAGDAATFESGPSRRAFARLAAFALLAAILVAFDASPVAFVALGYGGIELGVAARMRGWERRNGLMLYTAEAWRNKLYAR